MKIVVVLIIAFMALLSYVANSILFGFGSVSGVIAAMFLGSIRWTK